VGNWQTNRSVNDFFLANLIHTLNPNRVFFLRCIGGCHKKPNLDISRSINAMAFVEEAPRSSRWMWNVKWKHLAAKHGERVIWPANTSKNSPRSWNVIGSEAYSLAKRFSHLERSWDYFKNCIVHMLKSEFGILVAAA